MQILTGHTDLNYFLHKLGIVDSPLCPCGMEEETIEHVLCECIIYIEARKRILGILQIGELKSIKFGRILKFAGETRRF